MSNFLVLFKHELKMLFPILSIKEKKKHDILGTILSIILTLFIAAVVIILVSKIASGYIDVKIKKILDRQSRATELLNVLYLAIIILMSLACIKKMINTFVVEKHKQIYLRLPISEQTIFLTKLLALFIWTVITMFALILPINIIFNIVLHTSFVYWLKTILVMIFMPLIVFGISAILLIPALKIIEFLKTKYFLLFLILCAIVAGAFILYSQFLSVVQLWLETGSVKFLFNQNFVSHMQDLLKYAYPSNCFANIMLGRKVISSFITIFLMILISVFVAIFISNKLFHLTLYKTEKEINVKIKKVKYSQTNQILSLVKKEFICVSREPRYLFSYYAIAVSMPVMVYTCYTLFESLIKNAFGLIITFPLALLVLLLFTILTNTFCISNVTRDGVGFMKLKSISISPSKLLLAKIIFCSIISFISVIVSGFLLIIITNLSVLDGVIAVLVALIFSISQILIATRLDLNYAKFSNTSVENESTLSKNLTKVVLLGLIVAMFAGGISLICFIFFKGGNSHIGIIQPYIWPIIISIVYCISAIFYYNFKIKKSFSKIVN